MPVGRVGQGRYLHECGHVVNRGVLSNVGRVVHGERAVVKVKTQVVVVPFGEVLFLLSGARERERERESAN